MRRAIPTGMLISCSAMMGATTEPRPTRRGQTYVLKSLKGTAAEFLEAVPDAIVVTDGDGRMVFINTNAETLLGYRPEECVGRDVEMLMPERFRHPHVDSVGHYHADARSRSMAAGKDLVARHKDGREIPVDISLSPFPTDNGVLVIAAIRDVTDRRRAEEALRRAEQRYRNFGENAQDIIYSLRLIPSLGFEYISPAVTRVTGHAPEEYYADPGLGRRLTHPDDRWLLDAAPASAADVGPFVVRVIARDGGLHWLEHRSVPVLDDAGNVVAVEGIARDITETRLEEAAARGREAQMLAALEHLPFSSWAYDVDGRCFVQNAICKERWGDQIGMRIDEMELDEVTRARWEDTRRQAMAGEIVQQEESYSRNGEAVIEFTVAAPIRHDGRIVAVLGANIDVTGRRRARDLEVRLSASEESERLKDALLSTVSHELRSPISVIHGYATTALEYADRLSPGEFMQYFRDIDSAALRLERLVSDLLIMSRLDAGALRMDLKPMDVGSVVHEAVRTTGIAARRREFRTSIGSASIKVEGDPARLLEVLSNLLENADKFSPAGEPVEVAVETLDEGLVTVSVRDRGPGVPSHELDAIFGRFYRVAGRTAVRGTGLGLAISKSIIDGHGGAIWASLPADGGLCVTFSLRSVS